MLLEKASRQWSERPADQRYSSLEDLHAACLSHRSNSGQATVRYDAMSAVATDAGEIGIVGKSTGNVADLTHWAFGQLCQRASAPASYLRQLPAPLATECLNLGLENRTRENPKDTARLLLARNGHLMCEAVTSTDYERIWDSEITERLLRLQESAGWQPAPEAFDGSRGLYASDHDLFAFLVDNQRRIFETLPGGGLGRGFFVWNSEVGASSLGIMTFMYEYVCGNHRVWGASNVKEFRVRHVGQARERAWGQLAVTLRAYAESSASEDEARIGSAMQFKLGDTKEEVLDRIFGLRLAGVGQRRAMDAFATAEAHDDWYGDPKTAWGFSGGLTEIARDLPYADERVALDRAAGKVLELAF